MDELKQKYVGKYVAADKITDISIADFATPIGSVVFFLTYESGKQAFIPEKGFAVSVSDQPSDDSKMYGNRLEVLSSEIVKLVEEYDLPQYLITRLGDKFTLELENHIQRAMAIKLFGSPDAYAPGFESINLFTLLEAARVNAQFPPK